jgi:hypothetical protein
MIETIFKSESSAQGSEAQSVYQKSNFQRYRKEDPSTLGDFISTDNATVTAFSDTSLLQTSFDKWLSILFKLL